MSDEKLYNIPFDGERPEPHVSDNDPPGFVDNLYLANQKLAEAQALIAKLNRLNDVLIEGLQFYADNTNWMREAAADLAWRIFPEDCSLVPHYSSVCGGKTARTILRAQGIGLARVGVK